MAFNKPSSDSQAPARKPNMMRWFLVAIIILVLLQLYMGWNKTGIDLSYSEFKQLVRDDKIALVDIDQHAMVATERKIDSLKTEPKVYNVNLPGTIVDNDLMRLLDEKHVKVTAMPDSTRMWTSLLWFLVPMALVMGFLFFMNHLTDSYFTLQADESADRSRQARYPCSYGF